MHLINILCSFSLIAAVQSAHVNLFKREASQCDNRYVSHCYFTKANINSPLKVRGFNNNPPVDVPNSNAWYEVFKAPDMAVYGKFDNCLNATQTSQCLNAVRIMFGFNYNVTFFLFKNSLTDDVYMGADFSNAGRNASSYVSGGYHLISSYFSYRYSNGAIISGSIQKPHNNFALNVISRTLINRAGTESGLCVSATTPPLSSDESQMPLISSANGNTIANIPSCEGVCKSSSEGVVSAFQSNTPEFSTVTDNRVGWIYLLDHYEYRVLKRQVPCSNSNGGVKICTDRVLASDRNRTTCEFFIDNGDVKRNCSKDNGQILSTNLKGYTFSHTGINVDVLFNNATGGLDTTLKLQSTTIWGNSQAICNSFPGFLFTAVPPASYARLVEVTLKPTLFDEFNAAVPSYLQQNLTLLMPKDNEMTTLESVCFTPYTTSKTEVGKMRAFIHHGGSCRFHTEAKGYVNPGRKYKAPEVTDFTFQPDF